MIIRTVSVVVVMSFWFWPGDMTDELVDSFFEAEVELERKICRDVVCTSRKDEEGIICTFLSLSSLCPSLYVYIHSPLSPSITICYMHTYLSPLSVHHYMFTFTLPSLLPSLYVTCTHSSLSLSPLSVHHCMFTCTLLSVFLLFIYIPNMFMNTLIFDLIVRASFNCFHILNTFIVIWPLCTSKHSDLILRLTVKHIQPLSG